MANDALDKAAVLRTFQTLGSVGPATAGDLWELGYRSIPELRDAKPDVMYERMRAIQGPNLDRCVLYVFRCVTYQARTTRPDPELTKWWNWKD